MHKTMYEVYFTNNINTNVYHDKFDNINAALKCFQEKCTQNKFVTLIEIVERVVRFKGIDQNGKEIYNGD